jgi:hypothetical protein
MNAISQTRLEPISLHDGIVHSPIGRATVWWRAGCDFAEEAWEALAGVFGMPLRHPPEDRTLDRLDDQLLRDIGYERRKGLRLDSHF